MAATLGAVIITFLGTSWLQHLQSGRETRHELEAGIAELLAAAQDVLAGARALRQAHQSRTKYKYYLRVAASSWHAVPGPLKTWRELVGYPVLSSVLGAFLGLDREGTEAERMIALDAASLLGPKINRYFAALALLTLGQDAEIKAATRQLTSKLAALTEDITVGKPQFERLCAALEEAMGDFRDAADQRLR